MIQVFCVGCGKSLRAKDGWRGRKVNCRACGTSFVVPQDPPSVDAAAVDVLDASGSSGQRSVVVAVPVSMPNISKRWAGTGLIRLGVGILIVAAVIFFGRESIGAFFTQLIGPEKLAKAPGPLSGPVAFLAICIGALGGLFTVAGALLSALLGRR